MDYKINEITLRRERKQDYDTVEQITYRAFVNVSPTGANDDGKEALLTHKLRTDTAFVPELDYVAEVGRRIVGNIMYTKSKIVTDGGTEMETLTFGPVSVLPAYQRRGVGSKLIRHTIEIAKELGYAAVLIFGHESYYPRFGFRPASEYGITTPDGKNFPAFMALPLRDNVLDNIKGKFFHSNVFENLDSDESSVLNKKLAEPMDIDEYIAAQAPEIRKLLSKVREAIRVAAPNATEKISWRMPTFWQDENLIHFAAFKTHIGIYPGGKAVGVFAERLTDLKTSKGAIQFPINKPIDYKLISDITKWRVSCVTEETADKNTQNKHTV